MFNVHFYMLFMLFMLFISYVIIQVENHTKRHKKHKTQKQANVYYTFFSAAPDGNLKKMMENTDGIAPPKVETVNDID